MLNITQPQTHSQFSDHCMYRVGQKNRTILKVYNFLYNDIGRHSIHRNAQLFIRSKIGILNAALFKYSLHKVSETILH